MGARFLSNHGRDAGPVNESGIRPTRADQAEPVSHKVCDVKMHPMNVDLCIPMD
jgi:hypothetical protein